MNLLSLPIIMALPFACTAERTTDLRPQWTAATVRAAATTLDAIEDALCALATEHPLLRLATTCPEQKGGDGLDRLGLSLSYQHLPLGNYREAPGVLVRLDALPPGALVEEPTGGTDYRLLSFRRSRDSPGYHVLVYARDVDEPALADVVLSAILSAIEAGPVAPNPGMQRTRCARR